MLSALQGYTLILAVLLFLYPEECVKASQFTLLWVKSRILNYYLMFRAYLMYRRLRSDFAKMGVPMPAFKFVPIWERNGN